MSIDVGTLTVIAMRRERRREEQRGVPLVYTVVAT
jgi:hypothetical protein